MYKGIENITPDDKAAVEAAFGRWASRRSSPDWGDVKLLFDKFHEYVYRQPADTSCPSCVQYIFDYWNKQTNKWKEKES